MSSKKVSLNPKQQEAVEHVEGPVLVLAGAGSGKTRVLVERMVHLMRDYQVSPWNIFAVTFTNKAAGEMKARVIAEIGDAGQSLWISTFHSSCLRILRRFADRIGFEGQFVIYGDSEQKTLIKQILAAKGLSDKVYKPKSIQFHINKAKNEAVTPEKFNTEGDHFLSKVQEIYADYQQELKRNQAMDFGDLILNVLILFKSHPDILAKYQNQFQYIMVDEYQDTNFVQYTLIKLLGDKWKNICVVGDDDQSIYKFRGAEIRNILDYQKDYPDAKVVRLEQNYRSTQTILSAANAVISGNKARMGKELWTENSEGDKIKVYGAYNERDEAKFVARNINKYREEHTLNEMAVFYRTNAQSRSLEEELRKLNTAYKIFGGIRFYDRAEVKDVLAYLKVLVNPADSMGLKRILNVPTRGIGKTTVQKIDDAADFMGTTFWEVLTTIDDPRWQMKLNSGAITKLQGFVAIIQKLNAARADMPLDEFMTFLYETTGYWQMLTVDKSIEAESRKENLNELVNVVEEHLSSIEDACLETFLDQISLETGTDKMDESQGYVTLMTIHLAKGLEFPIVFLVGMEEGLFPHARSLDQEEDLEEERRLCYVGMTRSEKKLHLAYASERRLFGAPQYNFPSRFLDEIPEDLKEVMSTGIERPKVSSQASSYGSSWGNNKKPKSNFTRGTEYPRQRTHKLVKKVHITKDPVIDVSYSQSNSDSPYKQGTMVRHNVFGDGKVERLEGSNDLDQKVTVKFRSGITKKLSLKHANLMLLR
jgi:DNA helicase II / ATP-dependent DNA helicase PcrA